MITRKKIAGPFFAVMCASIMLAACGSGDGAKKVQPSEPADAQKVADTPTELTIMYPGAGEELFNQRFGDQIRKKFPNYTIKFVPAAAKDFAEVISVTPSIDIMFSSGTGMNVYLLPYKLETDIRDLVKKYNYDLSNLQQTPLDLQRQIGNGAIYGFPWTIGTLVSLYNKDLFDKFGVAYPKDGMSWDELYGLAQRLTRYDGGVQYRGVTMAFDHVMGLNQLSASYFDEKTFKARFTDDGFKKLFDNASRFLKIPGIEPPDNKYSLAAYRDLFQKAKSTAIHLDVIGVAQTTASSLTNWDFTTFPVLKDNPTVGPSVLPEFAFLTSKTKQRDAAFQVLTYLVSEQYQQWMAQHLAFLPTLQKSEQIMKTFGQAIPGVSNKNVQAIIPKKYADMQKSTPYYSVGASEMAAAANEFLAGKDVNTVLREAAERADKKVADMQGK